MRLEDYSLDRPDWRNTFAWPVPFESLFEISHSLQRRFVKLLTVLDGDERDIMTLARPLTGTAITLEMALSVQSEPASGLRVVGPPELDVLRGAVRPDSCGESSLVDMGARFQRTHVPFEIIRRLMRVLSWTPLVGLPTVLSARQALAVSHNPLLVAEARRRRIRLGFRHAAPHMERILQRTSMVSLLDGDGQIASLAERAVNCLTKDEMLADVFRHRTIKLLRPVYVRKLACAARVLGTLRAAKRLPRALWVGTGGFAPARALSIEVRRRGGVVTRFDHGGVMSLLAEPHFLAHWEFAVSTNYVFPSAVAAHQTVVARAADLARPLGFVSTTGSMGDPALDPSGRSDRSKSRRPRVMFVGTAYYGLSQTYPPFPPAPVYLDWQHRILKLLGSFPIELIHKPHPGGLFMGCPPGVRNFATIDPRPFERAIGDIDCFVFDIAASTTFSVALSTDRRIVLLDFACMRFSDEIRPLIEARCRIVPVLADGRCRATVDVKSLEEAVCGIGSAPNPDPFRRHFLAEGVGVL